MLKVNGSKIEFNEKDLKHDITLIFNAIEDELGVDKLAEIVKFACDTLLQYKEFKEKNPDYEEKKIKSKSHVIKASNLEEAIKITKELDIPEEIKNQIIKELKEMK